jgi:hypothetical protein
MMDLNFTRRRHELAIAKEINLALTDGINGNSISSIPDVRAKLIDQINLACERHQLDEAAAHRVMGYLDREIDRTTRGAVRANDQVTTINRALEQTMIAGRAS